MPGTGRLRTERDNSDDTDADALARRVAKHPDDTRVHVERINLHQAAADGDEAYAATVDFFVAMGDKGQGLRERMLNGVRFTIGTERYEVLLPHVVAGLRSTDPVPPAAAAVLHRGVCGSTVVRVEGDRRTGPVDALDQVRALVEMHLEGQAAEVMVTALERSPWRSDIHEALVELLARLGDRELFEAARRRVDAAGNPLPQLWSVAAADGEVGGEA